MHDAVATPGRTDAERARPMSRSRRSRLILLSCGVAALMLVAALGGISAFWAPDDPGGLVFVIPAGRAEELAIPTVDSAIEVPTDIRFGPNDVARITIINEDSTMNRAGPWLIDANQTLTLKFDKPGVYKYDCTVDPAESVVITVTE